MALYKISVKGLNYAGKVKLLYGYETKDFIQMLCPKYLNYYLKQIYIYLYCFRFCVFNFCMFLGKSLVWLFTQLYFKRNLSLPLYKILFQTKPCLALYEILFHSKALYKMESSKCLDLKTCFVHSMT